MDDHCENHHSLILIICRPCEKFECINALKYFLSSTAKKHSNNELDYYFFSTHLQVGSLEF